MKSINLVPRVPRIQQLLIPVVIGTVLISSTISVAMITYYSTIQHAIENNRAKEINLNATVQNLTKQRAVDSQTTEYNRFSAEVQKLKAERRSWIPVLDLISTQLPQAARLTTIDLTTISANQSASTQAQAPTQPKATDHPSVSTEKLSVNGEFADLNQIAEYIVRLQKSELIAGVSIKSATRIDQEILPSATAPTVTRQSSSVPTASAQNDYMKSLEQNLKPAESKGDELLNQLNWIVAQQMSQQHFGISLPDKQFVGTTSSSITDQSALTEEDIRQAKSQVENFKKQNPKVSSNSSTTMQVDKSAAASNIHITKFNAVIELTLKSQAKAK